MLRNFCWVNDFEMKFDTAGSEMEKSHKISLISPPTKGRKIEYQ